MHRNTTIACALALICCSPLAFGKTLKDEFHLDRPETFEFARKPSVTRAGDRLTVSFAVKHACDVTVAIENAEGRIVRHLAAGVLGRNAPLPFARDTLDQTLFWDGKNDAGAYIDDKDAHTVRVSLGLKPRFERQHQWSPYRRICNQGHAPTLSAPAPFAAQPEGMYVFDGSMHDHLRLFDHDGAYARTVYPFPSDKLDRLVGVKTQVFPQSGKTLPLKSGNYRSTLLTSGTNFEGGFLEQLFGLGATAMSIRNGRIALVGNRLNRLATDGTTGGLPLQGPVTKIDNLLPRSAALSPDGKTLYVTGWNRDGWRPNWRLTWVQGVGRIAMEDGAKLEPFAGVLSADPKQGGSGPGQFKSPVSVDTDPQGRVYVADLYNQRVQIFDPAGKHLKNLPIPGGLECTPAEVCVDQRNGDIFVFAWYLDCHAFRKSGMQKRTAKLFHFGPFEKPELKAEYPLPIADQSRRGQYGGDQLQGREFRAAIDSWAPGAAGPHIWLVAGAPGRGGSLEVASPHVLRMDRTKKTLETVKRFGVEAARDLTAYRYWGNGSFWLAVRPTTGEVFIQYDREPLVIQPDTGRARTVKLPRNHQSGGLYFDPQGNAYIRDSYSIGRYALSADDSWREIPFDYGEERGELRSAIILPTRSIHGQPGLSVALDGSVVAGYIVGKVETHDRTRDKERAAAAAGWTPWTPTLFVGRGGNSIVGVWDKHGRVLHQDAVQGVGYVAGVFMDRNGALYVASEAQRNGYFDTLTGTFAKFKVEGRILSTDSPLPLKVRPERAPDTHRGAGHQGSYWWEGAEWFYGGVGYAGKNNSTCHCPKFQTAHDYFARSFVPETGHYSVAVLDPAGNLIVRVGRYGNVDEGVPLVRDGAPPQLRPIGGDEVALFYPAYLATDTDRRLFIFDSGNQRLVAVRLDYHAVERVPLRTVPDRTASE